MADSAHASADLQRPGPPHLIPIVLAAAMLIWPALLNGYPLVFSDTGTYLSQIPHRYLGWDRPPFYSAFLLAFDWDVTTWPAIGVQSLLVAWVVDRMRSLCAPRSGAWGTPAIVLVLALASPLPWVSAELMPDVFTGLLALALIMLALFPDRLGRLERLALQGLASFCVLSHLGNLPVALCLGLFLALLRCFSRRPRALLRLSTCIGLPVLAAIIALCSVNLAGRGMFAVAPYGNVFLLARVIYDGPGLRVLQRDCPVARWRLCRWRDVMPPTADEFLWRVDSPLNLAGGPKIVSREADAIIDAAARLEPWTIIRAAAMNSARQLRQFATGDGLQPWPASVTPWLTRDFPLFERRAYAQARQTRGRELLPRWLGVLHWWAGVLAVGGCLCLVPLLWLPERAFASAILVSLLALLANAAVTGALSGPHDRYQSRVLWLPLLMILLAVLRLLPPNGAAITQQMSFRWRMGDIFWSGLEAAASGLLSFIGAFTLARLIGAAELGVGAACVSVNVLLWVGVNGLFADAIVQRPALDEAEAGSALRAGFLVGMAGAVLQVAALWPLRAGIGDPRLGPMCIALGLPLPFVGLAGPVQGLLTRGRDYRRLALRTVLGQGAGFAAGLLIAWRGGGAWAIAVQQAVGSLCGALVLLAGGGWRVSFSRRPQAVAGMMRVGLPLAAQTLILTGRYRVFAILVGAIAGPAVLGQVHMAFRLIETVRELASTAMWRLLLPVMARRQGNRGQLLALMDTALRAIAASLVPLCAVLALMVRPLVAMLLGPDWASAASAAIPLAALAAWMLIAFPGGVAAVARGRPEYGLRVQICIALLAGGLVLLLRPQTPLVAVLMWVAAHALIEPYALWSNAHVLGCSPWRTVKAGIPGLSAAGLSAGVALLLVRLFGIPGLAGGLGAIAVAAAVTLRPPVWRALAGAPARS